MLKSFTFLCCIALTACGNNVQEEVATTKELPISTTPIAQKTPLEILKEEALDEDDIMGRIESGLAKLQAEYDKSESQMPELGDVVIDVDERFNLSIENRRENGVLLTKVNMSQLDVAPGAFRLIPDQAAGDFPGLRIAAKNDEMVVEIFKDGKLVTKNNELVIYLATRENIEVVVPAMLQTVRLCQKDN